MTRRQFMVAGALAGGALVAGCSSGPWEWLSDEQARTLAVLCDEIVPGDDYPSASQADVVLYIDRQLTRHYRRWQRAYREGLALAEDLCAQRFGCRLGDASPDRRLQVAEQMEQQNQAFFELVRKHTLEGYYGSPRHGGNRDAVSWRMLGLAEPPVRGRAQVDRARGARS